jgi:hypothetical protein
MARVAKTIEGETTVAGRAFALSPSDIAGRVDDARRDMNNALRTNPPENRGQCEKPPKDPQEARHGDAGAARPTRAGVPDGAGSRHLIRRPKAPGVHRQRFDSIRHATRAIADRISACNHQVPHPAQDKKPPPRRSQVRLGPRRFRSVDPMDRSASEPDFLRVPVSLRLTYGRCGNLAITAVREEDDQARMRLPCGS